MSETPTDRPEPALAERLRNKCLALTFAVTTPCGRCLMCQSADALEASAAEWAQLQKLLAEKARTAVEPGISHRAHQAVVDYHCERAEAAERALAVCRETLNEAERAAGVYGTPISLLAELTRLKDGQ